MMNSIFMTTISGKRWFIIGWFIGLLVLAALLVVFYPSMQQEGSLDMFVESMPPAMQGLVGDLANLQQFSTYLASQLFDIRMQVIVGVMVIVLALSLTIGDEEKGYLRTTLSLPVSRTKVLAQKWLAMVSIIAITLLGTVAGILIAQLTIGESIGVGDLLRLLVMTWLVMTALATLTFAVALATGRRVFGTLVGIIALAGSFILTTFAVGVDWLKDYEKLSLFYYFPAVDIVKSGIQLSDVGILIAIIVISLGITVFFFRRRDITA